MRSTLRITAMIAVLSGVGWTSAHAEECNASLFKDVHWSEASTNTSLETLQTVDETNFELFKKSFGGNISLPIDGVPVAFGADYGSFDAKRREVLSHYRSNYSHQQAAESLDVEFSANSVSAYRLCLDNQTGLHLVAHDLSNEEATIEVIYHSPPGYISPLEVKLEGAITRDFTLQSNGGREIIVKRSSNSDVRIVANSDRGFYASLLVPPPAQYSRIEEKVASCDTFLTASPDTRACNGATARGYYWRVGPKISNYGTTEPSIQDPTEPLCDADHVGQTATTWRFPLTMGQWASVRQLYVAANNGGDPECRYVGNGIKQTDTPQGYHCGVFQAICTKQP